MSGALLMLPRPVKRLKTKASSLKSNGHHTAQRTLFSLSGHSFFIPLFLIVHRISRSNFYVDDFLYGSDSRSEILQIQADVTIVLQKAGMQLRKWLCNDRDLINKFLLNNSLEVSVLNLSENENCKTLGISWNSTNDAILYESSLTAVNEKTLTKRLILSQLSQIFDPLGLLGPIIIVGKILMQKLWQSNTKWDEIIPDRLKDEWLRFYKELIYLRDINIPRHVTSSDRTFVELHGFGDASEQAYGACVYLRTKLKNGHFISRLLCAKSRVAPLKKLSLPRLELSSAVLLARLTDKVKNAINIKIDKIFLWSDSTIALSWIRGSPSRWKTFVANRVGEIQRLTKIENWNHVSSRENPADLISRGTTILELKDNDFWWTGPKWLTQEHLPIFELQSISDDIPEQRSITNIAALDDFDLFSRFSSLTRLQRVTAYCLRFIANSKIQVQEQRTTGALSVKELQNALNTLIRLAQKDSFNREYSNLLQKKGVPSKSKILSLNPFMDSENILRVGGRLRNSEYNFDKKFPIILPSDHKLTKLILKHEHNRLLHCVRTKWKRSDTNNDIQVGKVVLLKEEDVPPMQWPLGIIVDLHPGKDNIVRVVSVKVRGQTLKRGVNKVCVLPEEF
ncbi:hypothetical protein NQ315_014590 [Exocentrus adspersus]|uniref:DUF5641 domain-containing protein n=1 Tax=Exocentrus adspersus TaxID=1586481 RepID=A0AAV8VDZ2_9CUCU|nr:hypothetical protein NQ315_014590 [Exocentrus adspersus]